MVSKNDLTCFRSKREVLPLGCFCLFNNKLSYGFLSGNICVAIDKYSIH